MNQIENYNWANLCCEKYCSEVETHYIEISMNDLTIILQFCEKHAQDFEDKYWEKRQNDTAPA